MQTVTRSGHVKLSGKGEEMTAARSPLLLIRFKAGFSSSVVTPVTEARVGSCSRYYLLCPVPHRALHNLSPLNLHIVCSLCHLLIS